MQCRVERGEIRQIRMIFGQTYWLFRTILYLSTIFVFKFEYKEIIFLKKS